MIQYLAEFFSVGGPFMFVNLVILAVAIATIVERVITLGFKLNLNARPFMEQIQKLVAAGNLDKAIKLTEAAPNAALAKVVRAGLSQGNRGQEEVSRALEEEVLQQTPAITRRIAPLWSLANVATLVGLIGTITGLITTFRSLGVATPEMKQVMLSRGIAEAMNNTAFGLIIAVVCIIAHLMLSSKAKAMVEELEFNALRLENILSRRASGEASPLDASGRRA
ncbi:MAG TPA: MotA/TolQ/ExbB proton channel family protein [Anaeromyxobacteraceae bacterium]|nr:MotA/TolQ/ExbB proton channel family protein [Anaeromyxobacteraceae bacterium]